MSKSPQKPKNSNGILHRELNIMWLSCDFYLFYRLLHKKLGKSEYNKLLATPTLGEFNLNLRKNIVDRILKLYHMTSHGLTVVNDNLSRAQGVIEVCLQYVVGMVSLSL